MGRDSVPVGSVVLAAAALLGLSAPSRSRAQTDCGTSREDELVVTPADRAEDVARNAPVLVRYEHDAELDPLRAAAGDAGADACDGQPVCLFEDARERGGSRREPVAGQVQWLDERNVAFLPARPLRAETDYFPLVTRAGFDAAARVELEFRTGEASDREPPEFDPAPEEFQIAVEEAPRDCDLPEGMLRVTLIVPRARDDGDEESVEILLFLTRAVGLAGPELRARARNVPRDEGSLQLRFLLAQEQAGEAICVALRAVDGVGRVSKGEPTLCLQPEREAHFESCRVSEPGLRASRSSTAKASLVALVALMLGRTMVRRRRDGGAT